MTRPVLEQVPGNAPVVAQLDAAAAAPVHAYLFIGPRGSGKGEAARAFAAALLCADGGCGVCRACRLALAGQHPDVIEVEPEGNQWLIGDDRNPEPGTARWLVRQAARSPVEGRRKVFVLHQFHAMNDNARGAMLKTIEEPSESSVFVGLVDDLPAELVTIASRCVPVRFAPLEPSVIERRLIGEGTDPATASSVAAVAGGNLERARVLARDPALGARLERFATVPSRLDGSGAAVFREVAGLLAAIDEAAEPLKLRQTEEIAAVDERAKAMGERASGRKALEDRHKREQRRHRTDELRAGLATLAATYRDRLVEGSLAHPDRALEAVDLIHEAVRALDRNPNEALLLQSLLLRLPAL